MAKGKKESFFWTSYSDLMTSLFFVMLVLFILTISMLHSKIKATEEQLEKIQEIEESVKNINPEYFQYDSVFKRHTLKNISVSFRTSSSNIYDISQEQLNRLLEMGKSIKMFVDEAVQKNNNVKYILILEGQSSKDGYSRNYELSYERALALYKFWWQNGVIFDQNKCEVIISGSGQASLFREKPDNARNKVNQRFVIHIIPKMGTIDFNKN